MFERIKNGVLRDMQTATESRYTDGPRDALVHNFLLVEVCDRLETFMQTNASPQIHTVHTCSKCNVLYVNEHVYMPTYHHLQEDQHDGIMVALFLNEQTAQALAITGGEDAETLHITLAYLGKVSEFPGDIERLKTTVAQFASGDAPISGHVGGIGRFSPSEHSDNLSPIVALVNMLGLQGFHSRLTFDLEDDGFSVANDFDFLPHVTLAYIDPTAPMPVSNIEALPLAFDTLWLCIGDQRLPYRLGEPVPNKESTAFSDQPYTYKFEMLDKDGKNLEPTNPQSHEGINDSQETEDTQEGGGTLREISEDHRIPGPDNRSEVDANTGDSATNANTTETSVHLANNEAPNHFKQALIDIATKAIKGASVTGAIEEGHLTNGIAQFYLEAQRYAYNKAMKTAGILAQEGIIGGIARGIKATFDGALSWAKEQVQSIASTLQGALSNFLGGLSDDANIEAETSAFLETYASWKAPQIANVTWGTGADLGTNAAIDDILEAATNPELPGLSTDNMRVRILPEESSSDHCADYAGKDYSLDEYQSLGVSWPAHPGCPHYADIYIDNGSDAGDEML